MLFAWKKKKGKTSNFVDAGSNNWNEREGKNSKEWIDRKQWRRKMKLKL